MKEDWAEQLRRKLEGHRKTPPPGLWEDICKEMDKSFGLKPLSRLPGTAQRYWAAAAVLALVGFFVFHNNNNIEQPQLAHTISQQPLSEKKIAETPAAETQASEGLTAEQPASKQLVAKSKGQVRDSRLAMNQATNLPDSYPPVSSSDEPAQTPSAEEEEKPTENVQTEFKELRAENSNRHNDPISTINSHLEGHHTSHSNKWSLGVNASGGLLAANTSQRMDRLYYQSAINIGETGYMGPGVDKAFNGDFSSQIPTFTYTMTEYKSEHHLPIRLGVSLNYQLTPRIALHSGISYTYLYSEFSIPLYNQANYDQELHYLGIPLGISWQFWKTNHFLFYVSGGAMLEKCVSAEANGHSVNKKPWQWSVDAKAGAEYGFTRHLGFYLEPSLGYYFDDGTALEHYYKKHPLTPTIEFGFRLHLNE